MGTQMPPVTMKRNQKRLLLKTKKLSEQENKQENLRNHNVIKLGFPPISRNYFPNSAKTSPMQPNSWTISRRRKIHLNNVEKKNDLKFWKILLIYYIKTKQNKNEGKIGNQPAANLIFAR